MRVTAPRATRNEVPWEPDYQYECTNGHHIGANAPCSRCPGTVAGDPCDGVLTRFGKGSQSATSP